MQTFRQQFTFNPDRALHIGVERECFLTDKDGKIVPIAVKVLDFLKNATPFSGVWGYELSACQLETRYGPCRGIQELELDMAALEKETLIAEWVVGFKRSHNEVAPETMSLDIYPDPSGRYQEIVKKMPREVLVAACRVIGTHIHIGMPDHESALRVYNEVIGQTERLCRIGDGSDGKRLEIYKVVAPECWPPRYTDWEEYFSVAKAKGFAADPRKCWTLIRISKHGTIEFRMFGATKDIRKILEWSRICHSLCQEALMGVRA